MQSLGLSPCAHCAYILAQDPCDGIGGMTKLLQQAIERLVALPEAEQDAVAARILAELEDDARWEESFAKSQDLLESMAEQALEEHRQGKTLPGDW
jgi:hypothetical protein